MKKIKSTVAVITLLLLMTLVNAEELTFNVSSGTLTGVNVGKALVTFDGYTYKYKLDSKTSIFSLDEINHKPIDIRSLKVGEKYYFEKSSKVPDPKFNDFDTVVFVSEQPLSEIDE